MADYYYNYSPIKDIIVFLGDSKDKDPYDKYKSSFSKTIFFDEKDNIYYSTVDRTFNPPLVVQVQPPIKTSFKVSVTINPATTKKSKAVFIAEKDEVYLNREFIVPTDHNGQALLKWVPLQLSHGQNFCLTFYTTHDEKALYTTLLNVKHDKAFRSCVEDYTNKVHKKTYSSGDIKRREPAEIGMSLDQFNNYNALVKEQHTNSLVSQENIQIIDFYRDAFTHLTKRYALDMKEVIQDLATAGIVFPKVSHTEQRLGSEHLQLPAQPAAVPAKPKPQMDKIKFSFKKLTNEGTWIEVPQTENNIVQYKESEPLVVKVENLHDFPVYFAVYEKRDGKFIKEYPKTNTAPYKMLPSVGDANGHTLEISCGKCKFSDKFNYIDGRELQTTVVEVTSTNIFEEMKPCTILIPLSIFVEPTDEELVIDAPINSITTTTNSSKPTYKAPINELDDVSDLLKQLASMGFTDCKKNEESLRRNNKNLEKTVSELIAMYS